MSTFVAVAHHKSRIPRRPAISTHVTLCLSGRVSFCREAKLGLTSALVGWAAGVGYSRYVGDSVEHTSIVGVAAMLSGTAHVWIRRSCRKLCSKHITPDVGYAAFCLPCVSYQPTGRALR